jgi:hypothetical protein
VDVVLIRFEYVSSESKCDRGETIKWRGNGIEVEGERQSGENSRGKWGKVSETFGEREVWPVLYWAIRVREKNELIFMKLLYLCAYN